MIDTCILSNHCDTCAKKKKKVSGAEFQQCFGTKHKAKCEKNHDGSASAMAPNGTERIFRRSEIQYNLRYTGFLGDGDSKSYARVENVEPAIYDVNIAKYECCGHVQKRMGRQLMNKVSEFKQKPFLHNGKITKGIDGRRGLTPKAIKEIQGHYGAAIRKNVNNTDQMRKDIWAIWEHRTKHHDNCGKWCPAKKNPPGDPDRNALHCHVTEVIKPVFETLTSETLLQKCAHGETQNTNESVHNVIWARCLKTSFVGRERER